MELKMGEETIKSIEEDVGLSFEKIRKISPEKLRKHFQKKTGKKFRITSEFPYIGRGNVNRDGLIDRETIDKEIDEILFGKKSKKHTKR